MEYRYCVYAHLTPSGEVFYIGVGTRTRPYSTRRSRTWQAIVDESRGYSIRIWVVTNDRDDAFRQEQMLIDMLTPRANIKRGHLDGEHGDASVGSAGKVIMCKQSGRCFGSLRDAARTLRIPLQQLRGHLSGGRPHIRGMTFIRLA